MGVNLKRYKPELVRLLRSLPKGDDPYGIRIKVWFPEWKRWGVIELNVQNPHKAADDSIMLSDLLEQLEQVYIYHAQIGPEPLQ